jgi:hypothetical protein
MAGLSWTRPLHKAQDNERSYPGLRVTSAVPATALVELAQIGEEPMHGRIEVRRLFRDSLTQLLELSVHEDTISRHSDTAR